MIEMDPQNPPASKHWQDLVTEIWSDGFVFEILSETESELILKSYETDDAWDPLLMAIYESDLHATEDFITNTQYVVLKVNRKTEK